MNVTLRAHFIILLSEPDLPVEDSTELHAEVPPAAPQPKFIGELSRNLGRTIFTHYIVLN